MVKKISRRERRVKQRTAKKEHVHKQRESYKKRKRNKKIFNYTLLSLLVIAVAAAVYTVLTQDTSGDHDELAKCITQSGAIMYGTDWCSHCQTQKQMFGKSFRLVNYINCDLNTEACDLAEVTGYPTWVFPDGERAFGEQDLEILSERTGCTNA